MGSYYK